MPEPAYAACNNMHMITVRATVPCDNNWIPLGIQTDAFQHVAYDTPPVRCRKSVARG